MNINPYTDELKTLLKDLCRIPAPSLEEDKRAEFCKTYFQNAGFGDAFCDEAKNAVAPWNVTEDNDVTVFMAHTDTVFPDRTPLPLREKDGRMYCPGIGDDTANLAILMLTAKILKSRKTSPKQGILFVANAAEEGLGNLKGSRAIADRYGKRIKAWISFDLGWNDMFVKAVGSARYRISVRTKGGHSFEDFGNENAIYELSRIIKDLYEQPLPEINGTKTTLNVGLISGGTSVNTIAQQAEMLYEYRSDSNECLNIMKDQLEQILKKHRKNGSKITTETVGLRPGMGICNDPETQKELFRRAEDSIRAITGTTPVRRSGSTDCNIPYSIGIPAVCFGLITMEGAHTREEWVETDSLPKGLAIALKFIGDLI